MRHGFPSRMAFVAADFVARNAMSMPLRVTEKPDSTDTSRSALDSYVAGSISRSCGCRPAVGTGG
jgi:hypothetical protein